jgi:hypothetical protein
MFSAYHQVKGWKILHFLNNAAYRKAYEDSGHSLKATQLIIRAEKIFGVKIDLRNLLSKPTIDSLSEEISTLKWVQDSILSRFGLLSH